MIQIALIGSCGYVGTMIYDFFQGKEGIHIDCFDIANSDVYPPHCVKNATEFTKDEVSHYDIFIYVAGLSRKEDCEKSNYADVYKMNVEEALHIPKLMSNSQLFLFSSTGSLYSSDNKDDVCSEVHPIDTSRFENYEKSMLARELELQKLQKRCIALRFGTVIGISKNMRPELLHNGIFNSGFTSSKFNIWNGNARRAVLYSEDLVHCLEKFIQYKDTFTSFDVFNLVSFNTSILETAQIISTRMNWPFSLIKNVNSVGFYMDNQKVTQRLGYTFVGSNEYICDVYSKRKDELVALFSNPQNRFVKCILCRSIRLESILDLGNQPLANSYLLQKDDCNKYPLHLFRCLNCFHTQLDYFVDREVLFKNYQYESGTSFTLRKYFSDFAEHYTTMFQNVPNKTVLELACNDGFQLDEFKERGWKTYGVDPAENLVRRGISRGHTIEAKFWAKEDIACIKDVSFNLIVAENVLAHVNNPINFLMKCEAIMNDETLLVIQTSQANMYFNNEFDTIYHEHISFFTIRSMMRAVQSVGCHLVNVYKTPIHGTSYVFEIKKGLKTVELPLLKEEESLGLYTHELYTKYQQNVKDIKTYTLNLLRGYKDRGYSILAFGAAAKGCVFLNYLFDSSEHELAPEHVIDESPLKLNKFLSGTLIHVAGMNILEEYTHKKVLMIILAWNFSTEILTKLKSRVKDMSFESFEAVSFLPNTNVQALI